MIVNKILSPLDFDRLRAHFINHPLLNEIGSDEFGRKLIGEMHDPILSEYSNIVLPIAKKIFKSETMLPSYALFAEYSAESITLHRHKDANACTYTVDLILYQDKTWGLWIDGVEYLAEENDAICFMGENKEHWRESIDNNKLKYGVVFFHYVEPDHWWFTEGKDYVNIVRDSMRSI